MAPEVHLRQAYSGRSVDLFAAAIILFNLVAKHPPFQTATPNDAYYKCLAVNRADVFWKTHEKNKKDDFFSDSFKDLIQSMLQLEPNHRPTISEILGHEWMQGPVPSEKQVQEEFTRRMKMIKENRKTELTQGSTDGKIHRDCISAIKIDDSDFKITKNIEDYETSNINTKFFSTYNPALIENKLVEAFRKN